MNDLLIYGIIIGVWFALQLWILPKLGIPTCMSGACQVPQKTKQPVDTNVNEPNETSKG